MSKRFSGRRVRVGCGAFVPMPSAVDPSQVARFTFPLPPSINAYGPTRTDRRNAFVASVMRIVAEKDVRFDNRKVSVMIEVCPPEGTEVDSDNFTKLILDAMKKARVYQDDRQVKHHEVILGPPEGGGIVRVAVREFSHKDVRGFYERFGQDG